ncbi:MAG TPA: PVC-type heme-binding CxxCH protein [Fimbriiglobus sp.]|jgi:putative membrane-bound dehydrogenase-like protein
MPRRSALLAFVLLASPAAAQLSPEKALAAMKVAPGFQCELFASEPMFCNPTSIDVDHKGRVWVCESVNYRTHLRGKPLNRKEGDRIVVLVDKTGEGKATEAVTFYQTPEVLAPIGIAVAPYPDGKGQKVFVCQSPNIWVFEDKDGDLKADGPPKVLLTGFRGIDHDHGVHGINIGPDGKLYFTVGDQGVKDLQSSDGKGRKWTSNDTDCQAGTVWRCDQDGTHLELIAHNFRNNYECCVDSFGEIWCSDNDDDGNQQTRICYVMPGGNYGYHPRGPGQSHWHEEQPGIVPKVLRTGFGSPTGICFYEGTLLPEKYRGNLLHCDAGPREVRAFFKKPKGAGYELEKEVLLTSPDSWFRPSDVCVAPDGSVFVADWYDPGVGGHGMGDTTRGRIYRLTPTGHKGYKVLEIDDRKITKQNQKAYGNTLAALASPCIATRTFAFNKLQDTRNLIVGSVIMDSALMGSGDKDYPKYTRDVQTFRAFWFGRGAFLSMAFDKPDRVVEGWKRTTRNTPENVRDDTFSLRLFGDSFPDLSVLPAPITKAIREGMVEGSTSKHRELLLALRNTRTSLAAPAILNLAKKYNGNDPFYLAALNIACGTDPARRDAILADFDKQFPEWNDKVADLVFELRPKSTLARLDKLLVDPKLTAAQKARIVDILAASTSPDAGKTVLALLKGDHPAEVKAKAIENLKMFLPGKWNALRRSDELSQTVRDALTDSKRQTIGLQLAGMAGNAGMVKTIGDIARDRSASREVKELAVRTLGQMRFAASPGELQSIFAADPSLAGPVIESLGRLSAGNSKTGAERRSLELLQEIFAKDGPAERKRAAVDALAGTRPGTDWLLRQKRDGKFPPELTGVAGRLLRNSPYESQRSRALVLFPAPGKLDPKTLPTPGDLAKKIGNAEAGRAIFVKSATGDVQCMKCHSVRGAGGKIGPDLSMIGKKGSKENLFESILNPSKAIADQYLTWKIETTDGQAITGLLVQETPDAVTLRDANGKDHVIPAKTVDAKKKLTTSLMPDDLVKTLTEEDLVDLVAYLSTLQTPAYAPESWHTIGPFLRALDPAEGIAHDFGPAAGKFDPKATFPEWNSPSSGPKAKDLGWKVVRPGADGRVVLTGTGADPKTAVSYAYESIESPNFQEATVLLNYSGLARVWVNGVMVHATSPGRKEADGPDNFTVPLKRGANAVFVKFASAAAEPWFELTLLTRQEVKGK